jgi:YrbI family 3-deoxy-D-manno-octulosonate 8-phosphate phosphatase
MAGFTTPRPGEELKKFNVKDGLGLKRVMAQGIQVAIISSNSSQATLHRARKLAINHTFIGVEQKLPVLKTLCQDLKISLAEVAYVGDDLPRSAHSGSGGVPPDRGRCLLRAPAGGGLH